MKLHKTRFTIDNDMSLSCLQTKRSALVKSVTKIFCGITALLLFCSTTLFSQPFPELEYRIINFRYEPSWTDLSNGPALVFELQIKAGANYLGCGFPITATDIMVEYNLDAGVVINPAGSVGYPPTPNPLRIGTVIPRAHPLSAFPPFAKQMDILVQCANVTLKNNFTNEFSTVAIVAVPITSGEGLLTTNSFLTLVESQPATPQLASSWSAGLPNPDPWRYFAFTYNVCPPVFYLGGKVHSEFTFKREYCIGDTPEQLPQVSDNGIQGTWSPSVISTAVAGHTSYTFTPDYGGEVDCEEIIVIKVNTIEIEVTNIEACADVPFDLTTSVVLNDTEIDDYTFYTCTVCDGSDYVVVATPDNLVRSSGTYTFYVQYTHVDSLCSSNYEPIIVTVGPPIPDFDVTCNGEEIVRIEINSPLGIEYEYSINGTTFQLSPVFTGIFTNDKYTVYVKNINTDCVAASDNIATCLDCAFDKDLTITDQGNGISCMGSGGYPILVTFTSRVDSVLISHDGLGTLNASKLTTSPFTVEYTPVLSEVGNTVTVTFLVPETENCEPVTKSVSFVVEDYPTISITVNGGAVTTCTPNAFEVFNLTTMATSTETLQFSESNTFVPLITSPATYSVAVNSVKTIYVRAVNAAGCYTPPSFIGTITITLDECFDLLDCDLMNDKTVSADAIGACQYTHLGYDWDAENFSLISPNPFSQVKYYVNGIDIVNNTLNNCVFPIGTSHVQVFVYYGTIEFSCEFYVTVNPICPTVSDPDGDGNTYPVYNLVGLCWTADLKTTTYMNTDEVEFAKGYKTSDDDPNVAANIDNFGRLYTWYSAVGVPEGSTLAPIPNTNGYIQGICPDGWHIPTISELNRVNALNANTLKSNSAAHWVIPGTDAFPYLFDTRGAGKYNASNDRFINLKGSLGFWACDGDTGNSAQYISFSYYCDESQETQTFKNDGLSVRCILDSNCP